MSHMNGWDWALLVTGGYLALVTLVRLMRRRRDAVLEEISVQAAAEKRRQQAEKKKQEQRKMREQIRGRVA